MPNNLGPHLFTFAIITDTHVNHGETECNSEFEINKLANGRMRHVIRDLNERDLSFVIHLGDVVHPVPAVPDLYERAAQHFRDQIAELHHPLHIVPGNHDIGDKPIVWGPAGVVREEFIDLWHRNFGANYQVFDHGECCFFLIDAQIINSGLAAETEQKTWLETNVAMATASGKRIFFNTHYPPYLNTHDEDEHFDNIAEPGRSWLLGIMERHRVEALFCGHVHNFWYNRHVATDLYALPSTAFVRQDYSEIYRTTPPPETEGGRSDLSKLGYFLVHVYRSDHLFEWVRTLGSVAAPGSKITEPTQRIGAIHPLQNPNSRFGFDMRQNWLEVVEIPPSGSLDEFDRKRTRNDYALLALLEMGVRRVRIPVMDLLDPGHRARLVECARHGLNFTLFSFGVPEPKLLQAVEGAKGLIDMWEIGHTMDKLPNVAEIAGPVAKAAGVSLYLSKIRSMADIETSGEKYHHMIVHGFLPSDRDHIAAVANLVGVDGIVFRVAGQVSPWRATQDATVSCRAHGLKASLHIRLSLGKPGAVQADESWVSQRVGEALMAASAHEDAQVYADTFSDVDRGYYRRQGVVDRFYNPRAAYHVVRHLNAALAAGIVDNDGGGVTPADENIPSFFHAANKRRYYLVTGDMVSVSNENDEPTERIDLHSGERTHAKMRAGGTASRDNASTLSLWIFSG